MNVFDEMRHQALSRYMGKQIRVEYLHPISHLQHSMVGRLTGISAGTAFIMPFVGAVAGKVAVSDITRVIPE